MRPARRGSVHEWAERYRIVPKGTSQRPGRWRSEPFQKSVLEAITDPKNVGGVLYVASSQKGGKTEILLNAQGYFIHSDPAPIIFVTYSLAMASTLSKNRVAKMIEATPCLRGKVKEAKSRDSANTILEKSFDGGDLSLVGANSAGGLSMSPKRVLLGDELDRWPASAGTEGDPLALARMRLESYWNSVELFVTSPGVRKTSRSWRLWELSDQREWHVACYECGHEQVPRFEHVQWEKDSEGNHLPETAALFCQQCGVAWDELQRWEQCRKGRYIATADFRGLAGFRISQLGMAEVRIDSLVRRWLDAQGNPNELQVFKNTVLAEWWDEQFHTLDKTGLEKRMEGVGAPLEEGKPFYPEVEGKVAVPRGVAVLTAGVDVQDNRLEVSVYGWGHVEECWHLDHEVIFGDPAVQATWDALGQYLRRTWSREAGGVDFIRGSCVDTGGHFTQAAYDFCSTRFRLPTPDGGAAYVFAIKGSHGAGEVWPRKASHVTKKVPVWIIRVDPAKAQLYGRLGIAEAGPGYIHFHNRITDPAKFFEQLTAQKVTTRTTKRGDLDQFWEKKVEGSRDEALACASYAYAALCGLRANGFDLEAEVARLSMRPVFEAKSEPEPEQTDEAEPERSPRGPQRPWLAAREDWLRRR